MKKFFLLSNISFCALSLFAQLDPVTAFNRDVVASWNGKYIRIGQFQVKGSPYLLGESFPGTINYKGGKTVTGVKILYDLYTQAAGIDLKNGEIFEAEQGVEKFTIELSGKLQGMKMMFVNSDIYGISNYKGYFNVLEDGEKIALLKAYKIKLISDPSNQMAKDSKVFDQYYEYYLYNKGTKQLQKIKLKEKEILKELNAGEEAKVFIRNKKLDLSQESGLITFIESFNLNFK